jgi:hypothetical protein
VELRSGGIHKKVKKMNDIKQTHPQRSSTVLVILAIAAVSSLYLSGMLPLTETLLNFAGNYGAEDIVRRQRLLLKSSNEMILHVLITKTAQIPKITILQQQMPSAIATVKPQHHHL